MKEKVQVTYKGRPIRIIPNFSMETLKARRCWTDVLHTLRDHRYKLKLLYSAKLSITINGENKIFHNKNRFKQYISTNSIQKYQKESSNPRKLIAPTKIQVTDNHTPENPKRMGTRKHYHQKKNRNQQSLIINHY